MEPERPLGVFAGLATLDVIQRADSVPGPNRKVTAEWQAVAAGGPAANAAVVFAALGGRARLLTSLGDGPVAALIRDDLEKHGVEVLDVGGPGVQPPVSSVIVNTVTGDRAVVSTDAGRQSPAPPGSLPLLLDGASVTLLDGHHAELAQGTAEEAVRQRVPVVLDAGRWRPVMASLLPAVRAAVCSADFRLPESSDPSGTVTMLRQRGVPLVAVTHGADPVHWSDGHASGQVPVPQVDAVDTLAAGDFFHGAFCRFFAAGLDGPEGPFPAQLAAAAEIAALSCTGLGPREWLNELQGPRTAASPERPGRKAM